MPSRSWHQDDKRTPAPQVLRRERLHKDGNGDTRTRPAPARQHVQRHIEGVQRQGERLSCQRHRQPRPLLHEARIPGAGALPRPSDRPARVGRAQPGGAGRQPGRGVGHSGGGTRQPRNALHSKPSGTGRHGGIRRGAHGRLPTLQQDGWHTDRKQHQHPGILRRGELRPARQSRHLHDLGIQRQHLSAHNELRRMEHAGVPQGGSDNPDKRALDV